MSEQEDTKQLTVPVVSDSITESGKRKYVVSQVTVVDEPDAPTLMRDALGVVADEILRFKKNSSKRALSLAESRVLQGYIKCLVDMQRESREKDESMDLANLSNDEILKLVEKMKGAG